MGVITSDRITMVAWVDHVSLTGWETEEEVSAALGGHDYPTVWIARSEIARRLTGWLAVRRISADGV